MTFKEALQSVEILGVLVSLSSQLHPELETLQFFLPVSLSSVCLLDYSHRKLLFRHFWSLNVWRFFPHKAILSMTAGCPTI